MLVAIALGDDAAAERIGQGVGGDVRDRALDVVEHRAGMRAQARAAAGRGAAVAASGASATAASIRSSDRSWQKKRISSLPEK